MINPEKASQRRVAAPIISRADKSHSNKWFHIEEQ